MVFEKIGVKAPVTRFDDGEGEIEASPASKTGELKLIYRGLVLEDGKVFDDYEWRKERWKWSKPYAGIVWVSPFFPEVRPCQPGAVFKSISVPSVPVLHSHDHTCLRL